jgi:hypothetical protein
MPDPLCSALPPCVSDVCCRIGIRGDLFSAPQTYLDSQLLRAQLTELYPDLLAGSTADPRKNITTSRCSSILIKFLDRRQSCYSGVLLLAGNGVRPFAGGSGRFHLYFDCSCSPDGPPPKESASQGVERYDHCHSIWVRALRNQAGASVVLFLARSFCQPLPRAAMALPSYGTYATPLEASWRRQHWRSREWFHRTSPTPRRANKPHRCDTS